jgi:hypothetical protein
MNGVSFTYSAINAFQQNEDSGWKCSVSDMETPWAKSNAPDDKTNSKPRCRHRGAALPPLEPIRVQAAIYAP